METLANAVNGPFLVLFPEIVRWGVWALATLCYVLQPRFALRYRILNGACYRYLALITVGLFTLFGVLVTWAQYFAYLSNPFSQKLLPPYQHWYYFFFSTFQRFWLGILVSVGIAFVFYIFLKALERYRDRFFETGETELGFTLALVMGWPFFLFFLPFALIFVVLLSVVRGIVFKEAFTTLGFPMILATGVTLLWGGPLAALFNLSELQFCLSCVTIQ